MRIIVFFILLVTSGCIRITEPYYGRLADTLADSYVTDVYQIDGLSLYGYGGGFKDRINTITFAFGGFHKLNVDQARQLYVNNAEKLLKIFNSDERIRPFLKDYPFTINNLNLSLAFNDEKTNHRIESPFISYVSNVNGKIYYYIMISDQLVDEHEEKYEDALRIVQEQRLLVK